MKKILPKLLEFSKAKIRLEKDKVNGHFKNKYVTLDNLIDSTCDKLNELGLLIVHTVTPEYLTTTIYDTESLEHIESVFPLSGAEPQKQASAITYAKRYNISALLNICTEEDDDGNATAPTVPVKKQIAQKPVMTMENVKRSFQALDSGKIKVNNANELVKIAEANYIVPLDIVQEIMSEYASQYQ